MQLAYNYGQYIGSREIILTKSTTFNGIEHVNTIFKFISKTNIKKLNKELVQLDVDIERICQEITNLFS